MVPALLTVPLKTRGVPCAGAVAGQALVTMILGAVTSGQLWTALALAPAPLHLLLPRTVSVEEIEQAPMLPGTVKLPVKPADWPGARITGPKNRVLVAGRSTTMVTF